MIVNQPKQCNASLIIVALKFFVGTFSLSKNTNDEMASLVLIYALLFTFKISFCNSNFFLFAIILFFFCLLLPIIIVWCDRDSTTLQEKVPLSWKFHYIYSLVTKWFLAIDSHVWNDTIYFEKVNLKIQTKYIGQSQKSRKLK